MIITVITFGTYDMFHGGHLNIFQKCKDLGGRVIVGISSDEFNHRKKGVYPHDDFKKREKNVMNTELVDYVFKEESMEKKREYIIEHSADILLMGSDWDGKFDFLNDICKVVYVTRTTGVSSTLIKLENKYGINLKITMYSYHDIELVDELKEYWKTIGILSNNDNNVTISFHKDMIYVEGIIKKSIKYKEIECKKSLTEMLFKCASENY